MLLSEIQAASDRAVQAHSRGALTVSVPLPPAAGAGEPLLVTETPQRVIEGPATLTVVELPQPLTVASAARQPVSIELTIAARVKHIKAAGLRRSNSGNSQDIRGSQFQRRFQDAHISHGQSAQPSADAIELRELVPELCGGQVVRCVCPRSWASCKMAHTSGIALTACACLPEAENRVFTSLTLDCASLDAAHPVPNSALEHVIARARRPRVRSYVRDFSDGLR